MVYATVHSIEQTGPLEEFRRLIVSSGRDIVEEYCVSRAEAKAATFLGAGQIDKLKQRVDELQVTTLIINHQLSAIQVRNLSADLGCEILDRTDLILDIFAQRAQTFEGKLQVELTQLQHLSTRLMQKAGRYDQQRGGIGLRGGAGETGLEVQRRTIRQKITKLQKRLAEVRDSRALSRQRRQRSQVPTIALVGYTNAGKSTLFNRLTQSDAYADDRLFATLDPTIRRALIPGFGTCVFADTVGFIQQLPHELINAFAATLEETAQADLILHVVDGSYEQALLQIAQVNTVLAEIGAEKVPQLLVFNKVDLLPQERRPTLELEGAKAQLWLSATTAQGLDELYLAILQQLGSEVVNETLCLPPTAGNLRAELHNLQAVQHEHYDEQCYWVNVKIAKNRLTDILGRYDLSLEQCRCA